MKKMWAMLLLVALTGCSNPASQQIKKSVAEVSETESAGPTPSATISPGDGSDINLAGLTFLPGKLPGELDGKQFYSTQSGGASLRFTHTTVERISAGNTDRFPYEVDFESNQLTVHAVNSDVGYQIMVSGSDVVMLKLVDYAQEGNGWPMMLKGRIASG